MSISKATLLYILTAAVTIHAADHNAPDITKSVVSDVLESVVAEVVRSAESSQDSKQKTAPEPEAHIPNPEYPTQSANAESASAASTTVTRRTRDVKKRESKTCEVCHVTGDAPKRCCGTKDKTYYFCKGCQKKGFKAHKAVCTNPKVVVARKRRNGTSENTAKKTASKKSGFSFAAALSGADTTDVDSKSENSTSPAAGAISAPAAAETAEESSSAHPDCALYSP